MKPEELLRALGDIDPEYIEEAEELRHKKRDYRSIVGIAACIALMVVAGKIALHRGGDCYKTSTTSPKQETIEREEGSVDEKDGVIIEDQSSADQIPNKIYVGDECYRKTKEAQSYHQEALRYIGVLGGEDAQIHADTDCTGSKVYRIDSKRIAAEIDGKRIVYKK